MSGKKRRKLRLTNSAREYADIDYLDRLNDEDRDYMMKFIDGYYNNNHRKYEMFTEHENYEDIKKDIYSITNARNRCSQSDGVAKGNLMELDRPVFDDDKVKLEDLLRTAYKENKSDDILAILGVKGFETIAEDLIDNTLHELSDFNKDHSLILIRFYTNLSKIIKAERKRLLNEKKIEKEARE